MPNHFAISSAVPSVDSVPLRRRLITDSSDLIEIREQWSDLLARSNVNELMLSPDWLLPWWRVYGGGRQLRCLLVYDADRLIGLVPLLKRTFRYRPGIPFRRLEFLGADVDEDDGVCSEYLGIIAERGKEEPVVTALTDALSSGEFDRCDEVVLSAMDGDNEMTPLLVSAFQPLHWNTQVEKYTEAAFLRLPSSWEAYMQSLGKHRRFLVKTLRDFDEWAQGEASYHRATTVDELQTGKEILRLLHAERWQQAGEPGAFSSLRFADFHEQVMAELFDKGMLDLRWLAVDGNPLAAIYNIRWNNKIYFYQSGRKTDLPKNVRPGIVLHAHCIREAIETGVSEYDFMSDMCQYKRQLSGGVRPLVRFRAVRPSVRERLRRLADNGIGVARAVRNRLGLKKK